MRRALGRSVLRAALSPSLSDARSAALFRLADQLGDALDGWSQRLTDDRGGVGLWTRLDAPPDLARLRAALPAPARARLDALSQELGPRPVWASARWASPDDDHTLTALWRAHLDADRARALLADPYLAALRDLLNRPLAGLGFWADADHDGLAALWLFRATGADRDALSGALALADVAPQHRDAWLDDQLQPAPHALWLIATAGAGRRALQTFRAARGDQPASGWRTTHEGFISSTPPARALYQEWSP